VKGTHQPEPLPHRLVQGLDGRSCPGESLRVEHRDEKVQQRGGVGQARELGGYAQEERRAIAVQSGG
jgi:hypothetical protein